MVNTVVLGGAALLVVPLGWLRQEEEAPPPLWLVGWLVASVALALVAGAQAGAAIVPALAVLVANALSRRARPDGALRWAAMLAAAAGGAVDLPPMLAAAQVGLSVLALRLAPADTTFFAAEGSGEVGAGDVVVVEDLGSDEAYLLRRRLGTTVTDASPVGGSGRVISLGNDGAPWTLDPATGQVRRNVKGDEAE